MLEKTIFGLKTGTSAVSRTLNTVGGGLLIIIVLLTVADVAMRRLFNSPIRASMELVEMLVGTVIFFSLGYCAIKGAHIAIDILIKKFPRRIYSVTIVIMDLISVLMCGILSWRLVEYSIGLHETNTITVILQMPTYVFGIMGALGYTVLTLAYLIDLLISIEKAKT